MTNVAPMRLQVDSAREQPPTAFVEAFCETMPEAYTLQYGKDEIRQHAAIAWRRGAAVVHVEQWQPPSQDAALLGVITDHRPGLLSKFSAGVAPHPPAIPRPHNHSPARRH